MGLLKDRFSPTRQLLHYNELDRWRRSNQYITDNYRPLSNSYRASLTSTCTLHNQTVNIWTHTLAFGLFLAVGAVFYPVLSSRYSSIGREDIVVFTSFLAGAILCFGFSTCYHVFLDHSEHVSQQWLLLDFLGIVCITAGSWVPGVYYGWYCKPGISRSYTSFILSLALGCAISCAVPSFRGPKWQSYNKAMFASLGAFGFIPMTHAAVSFGVAQAHRQMGWGWLILEAVFYISGFVTYLTKYPERAFPGRFNCFGASHQIFHVLVFAGALSHLIAITRAFNYNHDPETRLCDFFS